MDTILINSNGGQICVNFKFQSMQVVSYAFRIFNTEETQVFDKESGDSTENLSLNTRCLAQNPAFYINKKIRISVDIIDPLGAGNPYKIVISIIQNGGICGSPIEISGTSTDTASYEVRWRKFV